MIRPQHPFRFPYAFTHLPRVGLTTLGQPLGRGATASRPFAARSSMGRASYRTLRPQSADGRHAVAPLPDAALSWRGPDPTRCIARHPHL